MAGGAMDVPVWSTDFAGLVFFPLQLFIVRFRNLFKTAVNILNK